MRIYIIDDDITVIKMLENIIEDNDLGTVCGYSLKANECTSEIAALSPDIVLVDLLMPEKDGITVVNELNKINSNMKYIMISQVSSKNLVGKAYSAGIDFFINKPINIIEVKKVIENVTEKIKFKLTLEKIKDLFIYDRDNENMNPSQNLSYLKVKKIKLVLNKLGMSGEKGAKDIIDICQFLIENNKNIFEIGINEICSILSSNSKNMEQRIRRAISKGLTNLAYLGIEDYMNEIFITYANSLYNFEEVKSEMDYIRGKKNSSGKVNIKKFIDGLMINVE
ncbi:response regulator [Sedimentibacter sp. MB31-C6]|uniref:response regulator n=1 Tax=Sedimentibacter sp. MB31-C6 TaxID=3109366 RepID=UPI002DDD1064|nr:response regulator [Sedimentibacter sp. MB36-C1]WSI03407.1 response regulator [Sedimentibacter sp. MB36-C1]